MVKFRKCLFASGTSVIMGKDAESNDELVRVAKDNETLIHTVAPGSPFVNVGVDPSNENLKLSSGACVMYSQDWRDNNTDTHVNIFKKKDMSKSSKMKPGTWKVKKQEKKRVKKSDVLKSKKELVSVELVDQVL